jgi:transcription factor Dp-1
MMVCQKVEEKGTTTYNEVADELVKKVIAERRKEDPNGKFDEKNIRRRVYDALNVLMAMDIISKEKKEITWRGLPTADRQDLDALQHEIEYRRYQLRHKKEALKELLTQQVCFRNLVLRNSQVTKLPDDKIPLPFIVVNTNASAVIQCDMSRDRTDVMFDFSMPFEINDDNTILKKMGM